MVLRSVFTDDSNRGVSAPVGIILIMGFVVIAGIGTLVFAQQTVNIEDPKANADFTIETDNSSGDLVGQLVYDRGSEFTSDNTEKLYIVGQTADGTRLNGSNGIMLYDDGNADHKTSDNSTIKQSDVVVSTETADGQERLLFDSGTGAQVVWEPERNDEEIVLDEFVIPDESTILQRTQTGGNFIQTNFTIEIDT